MRGRALGRSMRAKSETPLKIGAKEFGGSQMKTNMFNFLIYFVLLSSE